MSGLLLVQIVRIVLIKFVAAGTKALEDKTSTEDTAVRLRRQLTDGFYALYSDVFKAAINAPKLPSAVKMFLYFGYVDEELAGTANLATLYELANGTTIFCISKATLLMGSFSSSVSWAAVIKCPAFCLCR